MKASTDTIKQNYPLGMPLLTPDDVAKLLKVNKRTVYYWIERGLISYVKINRKTIRFRYLDVEDFINKHLVKPSDVDKVVNKILSKLS